MLSRQIYLSSHMLDFFLFKWYHYLMAGGVHVSEKVHKANDLYEFEDYCKDNGTHRKQG